jgi:hypothetical protein
MAQPEEREGNSLSSRLRHVYWVGGGSGAAKSTIARRLATKHGLRFYPSDDAMADHSGAEHRREDQQSGSRVKQPSGAGSAFHCTPPGHHRKGRSIRH